MHGRTFTAGVPLLLLAGDQPLPIGEPAPAAAEAGMVLTDNHAPVEYLIALDVRREDKAGGRPR